MFTKLTYKRDIRLIERLKEIMAYFSGKDRQ